MRLLNFLFFVLLSWFFIFPSGCKNSPGSKNKSPVDSTDKFADNIRRTPFQEPEDERRQLKLPEGFEITLFASEPDIHKPINMEFDERGRLWVTNTVEYPMPARNRHGRDRITILEDTDGDGKADKFTDFVDTLNIPIGITLVKGGAVAYSIPNIYKFIDKDGDDKADTAIKLIGPFEYEDTHGMVNNLLRGFDGWIYACHGYANNSTVAGADGDSIHMSSGNTFRFREDGSRVEATTFGRINPFGYSYDDWGYLYSLDCHTKPIYQLIPGAQYPAQGFKEPAIGWAPNMMSYEFGSTANSGMVYYIGTQFPDAYKHNFYSGNVVTSRINRNTMTLHGSSPESKREEDFLVSEDPWFRPVDIKLGPDGSMYVADFYNRIIGHYEVPKDHPGRDRTSGRIWKITYTGNKKQPKYIAKDWSKEPLDSLVHSLNNPQLNMRMMIANLIVDAYRQKAAAPVLNMMNTPGTDSRSFIQGLWILYRLNALPESLLKKGLEYSDPMVQVHALRVLTQMKTISDEERGLAMNALNSANPQVQRIALQVLGKFPEFNYIKPIISLYDNTNGQDSHLKYAAILGIRSQLRNTNILNTALSAKWNEDEWKLLDFIMPEIHSKAAAMFAFNYLKLHALTGKTLEDQLDYISSYSSPAQLNELVALTQKKFATDTALEYKLYKTISEGVAQQGGAETGRLKQWGQRMEKLGLAPAKTAQVASTGTIDVEERKKLIADRIASYNPSAVTVEEGKKIFTLNCTPCHRIGNDPGGSIGPQLSGIGTWGQRAITEKVLNPNGSISTAYRTYNITLKNGEKLSGLYRREEGKVLVFANYGGQEFIVPKAQIQTKEQSKFTLMPDQFRNTIAKNDFDALLKYLLTIKDKK